jgi:hypothetical protein
VTLKLFLQYGHTALCWRFGAPQLAHSSSTLCDTGAGMYGATATVVVTLRGAAEERFTNHQRSRIAPATKKVIQKTVTAGGPG